MTFESFSVLFWREFDSVRQGAEYFHVKPVTVRRWLRGESEVNPMAEKLLIIKSIGYLPNDSRWTGFKVNEERGVLVTPSGREFNPIELESWAYRKDEYHELVKRFGHVEYAPKVTAVAHQKPFRGGRRCAAAPWIPSKQKARN